MLLHEIELVHDLGEVVAGLGGLAEGEAFGIEVIGHAPIANSDVVNNRQPTKAESRRRRNRRTAIRASSPVAISAG